MIRQLKTDIYNAQAYTDENALAKLQVTSPDWISKKFTYIHGVEHTPAFSFLAMTEGNGAIEYKSDKDLNDVQYKYPVMGKMRYTVAVKTFDSTKYPRPCISNTPIVVTFTDNWGIVDYGLITPDQKSILQIVAINANPIGGYDYTLEDRAGTASSYISLDNFAPNKVWLLAASKVPESGSKGNENRRMSGGIMTNQISFDRYSWNIEGNVANKVAVYEFSGPDTKDGNATNLWINEEQRQFDIWIRTMKNLDLYLQKYNRVNGEIPLKYWKNGKPIPIGAGVEQQITEFGTPISIVPGMNMTTMLEQVLGAMSYSSGTKTKKKLVLHGGKGLRLMIDKSFKDTAIANQYQLAMGTHAITEVNGGLSYGKYFVQYKDIDGNTITCLPEDMFEKDGQLGMQDLANGRVYNGLPFSSYSGVLLDYSEDESGDKNITYHVMKGQSYIAGVVKGLTPIPASWGVVPSNNFASDDDKSSYEVKISSGINIKSCRNCAIFKMTA